MEIEVIINELLRKCQGEKNIKRQNNQSFLNEFTDKLSIRAMQNAMNK